MKQALIFLAIMSCTAIPGVFDARAGENAFERFGRDISQAGRQIGKAGKDVGKKIGKTGKHIGEGFAKGAKDTGKAFRDD